VTISDQTSDDDIGRYAGWGSADDLHASAETDPIELRPVRSMGWRSYRGPGSGLMLLYPIGLFGLLVAELSLGVPALPTLLSLIALAAAFTIVARRLNRPPARASGGADRSATKHGAAAQGDGVVAQAAEFGPSRSDRPALAVDVAQADEKPTRNVAQKPPPPVEPPPGFTEGLTDALTTASLVQGENFSPDGLWCWDGTRWVSAISPDGLWR
jgi:predicted lipid-binding transport protein (Tim44 family)